MQAHNACLLTDTLNSFKNNDLYIYIYIYIYIYNNINYIIQINIYVTCSNKMSRMSVNLISRKHCINMQR